MIQPAIGDRILFWGDGSKPTDPALPAIVVTALNDVCVDLVVFGCGGAAASIVNAVRLFQPEEVAPDDGYEFARWSEKQAKEGRA